MILCSQRHRLCDDDRVQNRRPAPEEEGADEDIARESQASTDGATGVVVVVVVPVVVPAAVAILALVGL